ncbi:alpha/beta hydrolase [Spongiactinospora rosea]|uniref:Alpha/beta hydrolase n=1 Tax=Spongiactinospora rosea TaxID=2248750 RepID=A0A366LTS6_9ACTN|nr:alpha/beta hydrolase [Spongiactinospora rosea]RBQ16714.1 alpha/beta hydrolase [Spongiactinospora rosea]
MSETHHRAPTDWTGTPQGLDMRVLRRPGTTLHYWTGGRDGGTPVTFLHGATMDHRMFNAQIPGILGHRRALVWDARGHGRSQPFGPGRVGIEDHVDDLVAMLDDAGVEQTVIVGQSMGGYIAQHAVRLHPHRFRALVVIGSTPIEAPLSATDALILRLTYLSFGLMPRGALRTMFARATSVRDDVRAYAVEAIGQVSRRATVQIFAAVASALSRRGLPGYRVEVPFLLTHGEHDGTGDIRKDGPGWAASDPRIRYVVIPDAGHNANQDNPEVFNREFHRLLAGLGD